MIDRDALIMELTAAGQNTEAELNIGTTALTLAALSTPEKERKPYQRHLKRLVTEVAAYVTGQQHPIPLKLQHEALIRVIHERYGYLGTKECFDDIEAANLMHVIETRRGLPVALGILYLHVATHMGWVAAGLDFPGRFLLRLDAEEGRLIFDPFEGPRSIAWTR